MKQPRLPQGSSDPVSFVCTCACSSSNPRTTGLVLLFYRYFSAPPQLPFLFPSESHTLSELSSFHESLSTSLSLGGKIRVGTEGFNATVAGRKEDVERYIEDCAGHWSFQGLELEDMGDPTETREKRDAFFKPTLGCACVFGGAPASVRITSEITPMGVTGYVPREWEKVKRLSPEEFHALCWGEDGSEEKGRDGKMVLLDVRNHYESRIGYFVDPRTGKKAVRPEIRRFAQWPGFVRRWVEDGVGDVQSSVKDGNANENQDQNEDGEREATENGKSRRKIMAYCTGGIRCEKATRWMVENASMKPDDEVYTLEGGIQAYLTWMAGEIRAGRKSPKDSLFKGRNYVFDARGSLGFGLDVADEMETEPVAACHICGKPEDRLSKCRSRGCHLVLVVCKKCEDGDVRCCGNCRELDTESMREGPRPICLCEMERETKLWGDGYFKKTKVKGKRKGKEKTDDEISIQVKTIAN